MIEDKKKDADSIETTELPEHHRIHHLPLDKEYCDNQPDALESILQNLNDLFSAIGVEITVDDCTLTIDVAEEKFASVTTRKAGRKKKDANQRYEEIMACRDTHTAQETFEWLGLTKQTYYRRIKELRSAAEEEEKSQN